MMSPRVPQRYQGARVHPGPTSPGQFRQRDPEGITGPIATAPTSLDASCSFVSSSSLFLFVVVCSFERIRVERMSLCCVVLCCVFCRRTVRFVRASSVSVVLCVLFFFRSFSFVLFFLSFFFFFFFTCFPLLTKRTAPWKKTRHCLSVSLDQGLVGFLAFSFNEQVGACARHRQRSRGKASV